MTVRKYQVRKHSEEAKEGRFLKSTPFIVCDIFLERYCIAGVLTILPIFLHEKLGLAENYATSFFHIFGGCLQVFAVLGTIVADTWIGLYRAVVITSTICIAGLSLITMTMVEPLNLPTGTLVAIGLMIITVGSGSLKSNLNAFGGGQHKLPEQKFQLETYFSVQYFFIKFGSFLTRIISPIIRTEVKCFGSDDCYAVSFGIPAAIMTIATIVFLCGSGKYIELKPNGNMLVRVVKCIKNAIKEKQGAKGERVGRHWLDYSEDKYGKKLVMETKIALKVMLMSLTVPIFWACLMQQRSRWIFQASKLDGDLGFYTIKPDQMIVMNSLMAIALIPLLDKFVYPLLERVGIKSMLQRLVFGGILIIVAFTMSAILESQIHHKNVSILWQFPQFVVIGAAEIFTYLAHLNFAYKEAPPSMKPVMMSLIYLSMAGGDAIISAVSAISLFPSQAYEFAFYTGLVLVDVVVLAFLAHNYHSTDHDALKSLDNEAVNKSEK